MRHLRSYFKGPGYITAGRNIEFSYGLSIFRSTSKTESRATFCRPPAHQKNEARWLRRTHFHPPRPQANLASSAAQIQQLGSNQIVQPKNHSTGAKKKDWCNSQGLYTQKSTVFPHSLKAWSRISNKIYPAFFCPVLYIHMHICLKFLELYYKHDCT